MQDVQVQAMAKDEREYTSIGLGLMMRLKEEHEDRLW